MTPPRDKTIPIEDDVSSARPKKITTESVATAGEEETEFTEAKASQDPAMGEPELSPLFSDETQQRVPDQRA